MSEKIKLSFISLSVYFITLSASSLILSISLIISCNDEIVVSEAISISFEDIIKKEIKIIDLTVTSLPYFFIYI